MYVAGEEVINLDQSTRSFKLTGARCSDHLAGRRSRDLDISEA